jgi:hypothetical protein
VRGPHLSTWLPATTLPGTWQQFWQGHTTAMGSIVRIVGTSYQFMVDPTIILNVPNGNYGTPTTVPWVRRNGTGSWTSATSSACAGRGICSPLRDSTPGAQDGQGCQVG